MQVGDGFAGIGAIIEDEAESVFEAELFGDFGGFEEQMSEDGVVGGLGFSDARDGLLRHDEDVDRRLWFDVMEGNDPVILVNNGGRNFARYDFFKQRFAHVQLKAERWDSASLLREVFWRATQKGQTRTSNLLHKQRAIGRVWLRGKTVAEEFHDLVMQSLAARAPTARTGELFDATAQAAEVQQLRVLQQLLAHFVAQPGKEEQFKTFAGFAGELPQVGFQNAATRGVR